MPIIEQNGITFSNVYKDGRTKKEKLHEATNTNLIFIIGRDSL